MSFFSKLDDFFALDESNTMKNKDLVPMPLFRRKWGMMAYIWYWGISAMCAVTWSGGSSLLSLGLNGNHAMGIVVVANVFISIAAILNGYYGAKYHIGFSVFQRVIFGIRGSAFGVLIRSILSVVWFASESWLGGLCVNVVLSSWSRSYLNWENTFPDSVPMTNQQLCGFVVYLAITVPFLAVRPEYLDYLLAAATFAIFFMGIGITSWAVHVNGGKYGSLMNSPIDLSSSEMAWAWIYGLSSWYSSLTAGIANQADFSRFNKSPKGSSWGIFLGTNLTGFIVPLFGIISASALYEKYGVYYWMPNDICIKWLQDSYDAKSRAAAFFCGLSLVISQLGINCVGNCISGAMDISSLCPRYINIRRGSILVLLLSWPTQPWLFYNSDSIFLTVLSSFSVFVTPLIAIYVCDFYVIRRCQLKLSDCFLDSTDSIYWFDGGFNWRSFVSFLVGVAPGLPGLINAANPSITIDSGALHFFQGSFIFQFLITFAIHLILNLIFKVNVGQGDEIDIYDTFKPNECARYNISPYRRNEGADVSDFGREKDSTNPEKLVVVSSETE
ncbi:DEKNAAC103249 [Brettanomyces naardenensis]|uniref:DEKNAAC103249 n=1 Tax=Brettanomyces naardenensis TaxID=13370 RepID=A0A448YMP6_BRENA|nr:DEKNAAC103249 [Brettanomyces naardenensis]